MVEVIPDFSDPDDRKGHRKHLIGGALLAALIPLPLLWFFDAGIALPIALILSQLIFFGKEAKDAGYLQVINPKWKKTSGWSWADIVADETLYVPVFLAMVGFFA
jgi:hypothetical protein